MVGELMREAWGRTYTQKDTADYIKRSIQTLAKMGNPDSSVVNADKVVPPGTVQMSGAVAAPEGLVMPPEETRADIEEHVRRLAPPAEFLQRGKELIGTQRRGGLRWPGQRSFCKVVGQSLGGLDASGAWRWLEADRDARAIVAARFVEEESSGIPETRLAYVAGADQLLDPRQPQRWGLLRAVADELSTHAAKSEDVHLDQATRDYHLGACWAWYLHPSPRTALQKATLTCICPSPGALCQGRVGRRPFARLGGGDSPTLYSVHLPRHGGTQRPLPVLSGRGVPNYPRLLQGRCRRHVSEFAPMCDLQSWNQRAAKSSAGFRASHTCIPCIPRRHALGARRGLPGAAGALSCDRRTVHLPTVSPGGKFCP